MFSSINRIFRLGILSSALLSSAVGLSQDGKNCMPSQFALSRKGLERIAQISANAYVGSTSKMIDGTLVPLAQAHLNEALEGETVNARFKVPSALFEGPLFGSTDAEFEMKNLKLKNLKLLPPEITCDDHFNCTVKAKVEKISYISDLSVTALSGEQKGEKLIDIRGFEVGIDTTQEPVTAPMELTYTFSIDPSAESTKLFKVDPESAKFQVDALELMKLNFDLDLSEDDVKLMKERAEYLAQIYKESNQCVGESITLAKDVDEALGMIYMDVFKDSLRGKHSFSYYFLLAIGNHLMKERVKEVAKETKSDQELKEYQEATQELNQLLSDFLKTQVGPLLAEVINDGVSKEGLFNGITAEVPVVTPKEGFFKEDYNLNKEDRKYAEYQFTGVGQDPSKRYVLLEWKGCEKTLGATEPPKPLKKIADVKHGIPIDEIKADVLGSVSLDDINAYLREVFSGSKEDNRINFQVSSTSGFLDELKKKLGIEKNVDMKFLSPPQLISVYNVEKKEVELKISLEVDERWYRKINPITRYTDLFENKLRDTVPMDVKIENQKIHFEIDSKFHRSFGTHGFLSQLVGVIREATLVLPLKRQLEKKIAAGYVNKHFKPDVPELQGLRPTYLAPGPNNDVIFALEVIPDEELKEMHEKEAALIAQKEAYEARKKYLRRLPSTVPKGGQWMQNRTRSSQ